MRLKDLRQIAMSIMFEPHRCTVRTPLLGFNPRDPSQHNTLRLAQVERRRKNNRTYVVYKRKTK